MKPIDIIILIVVAILILLALRSAYRHYSGKGGGCCGCSGGCSSCGSNDNVGARGEDLSKKMVEKDMPSKIMRIEGMHCENCRKSVEKALLSQNGVIRADADVERGIARIFYEKAVDDEALKKAVEDEGFVVKNIEVV